MSEERELVVVTGGAGFIGSHTVDALLARGHQVAVVDNFSTGRRDNLSSAAGHPSLDIVEADVVDGLWGPLADTVRRRGAVTRIIHLAAQTSVVASIQNPLHDLRVNYMGTNRLMEYARHEGVEKVVFASSAAVYGDVADVPVSEEAPTSPLSPYGVNKLSSELLLRYYASVHGVATQPLRFFNVYGPRQDPRNPYTGVISIFFERALRGQDLTIFGDGHQTRDFVYVGDVARTLVEACLRPGGQGEPCNLGTGCETSVNELARHILLAAQSSSAIHHADARPGEILRSCADIQAARAALDYEPTVSLAEGLRMTAQWMRSSSTGA